jgi:hypothetical protein
MATKKIKRFQEGGVSDKDRGLEASKDEKVGFFERLRMGNIDEEGSEAYNRFGAGRGRAERISVEDRVATPEMRPTAPAPTPEMRPTAPAPAPEMDEMEAANRREPIPVPAGPRVEAPKPGGRPRVNVQAGKPVKPAVKPAVKNEIAAAPKKNTGNYSNEGRSAPTAKRDTSNYSNEGRGREMSKEQQFKFADEQARTPAGVAKRKQMEKDQAIERVYPEEMLAGGFGLKGIQMLAKKAAGTGAKKSAESGGSRALSAEVDDGVTFLGKSGRRQVGGFDEVGRNSAKRITDNPTRQLPAPPKKLGGPKAPSKKKMTKKEQRDKKTLNPLAWMSGPKGMADDFKKGGKVKMASGGSVSSASKRGDGIATRGMTNCKMR